MTTTPHMLDAPTAYATIRWAAMTLEPAATPLGDLALQYACAFAEASAQLAAAENTQRIRRELDAARALVAAVAAQPQSKATFNQTAGDRVKGAIRPPWQDRRVTDRGYRYMDGCYVCEATQDDQPEQHRWRLVRTTRESGGRRAGIVFPSGVMFAFCPVCTHLIDLGSNVAYRTLARRGRRSAEMGTTELNAWAAALEDLARASTTLAGADLVHRCTTCYTVLTDDRAGWRIYSLANPQTYGPYQLRVGAVCLFCPGCVTLIDASNYEAVGRRHPVDDYGTTQLGYRMLCVAHIANEGTVMPADTALHFVGTFITDL